jgi:CRISPR/Cas system-associated exonuclease Cas4 (RecB family)
MKPLSVPDRKIAVTQLIMASHCLFAALATAATNEEADRNRSPEWVKAAVLGDAVHKFLAGKDTAAVVEHCRAEAPQLATEDLTVIVQEAQLKAERVQARRRAESRDVRKEKTVSWKDPKTLWEIFSTPDVVETPSDAEGDYVRITDWKLPKRVRDRHIEIVQLFGLIVRLLTNDPKLRIELVVESIDENKSYHEWMGPISESVDLLEKVRETFAKLEAAAANPDRVPPRTKGDHCFGCKLREQCREGGKYIARVRAEADDRRQRFARRTNGDDKRIAA